MSRRRGDSLRPVRPAGAVGSRRSAAGAAHDTAEAVALLDGDGFDLRGLAELQEFMASDRPMRESDIAFRERLRTDLWWGLLVQRSGGRDRLPRA